MKAPAVLGVCYMAGYLGGFAGKGGVIYVSLCRILDPCTHVSFSLKSPERLK